MRHMCRPSARTLTGSSGRVSKAGWDEKLGWYVEIEGEDGFYYFYAGMGMDATHQGASLFI